MKTPRKKKVAFYTPSKKKIRCIQQNDEKGIGDTNDGPIRYMDNVPGTDKNAVRTDDGMVRHVGGYTVSGRKNDLVSGRKSDPVGGRKKEAVKKRGGARRGGKAAMKDVHVDHDVDRDESSATSTKENSANTKNSKNVDTRPSHKEILYIENELLQAYREENAFLKTSVSSATSRLTGFTVTEPANDHFIVSYSAYDRHINFRLVKNGRNYEYELIEHRCVELPEFLTDELVFGEEQLPKFFFNVMQVMVGKD
ncbi:hypothetical protein THOM_2556 [Trachipleistophora hominis]|uniref:DUF5094 domain-containing protein n=1 Tax=Trachipleistophora hominis TaxID=72359 RepID=L7JU03_TRAHO|nr:hypothetical protein THOM_2556 [Trachipleistophora hominis]